MAPHPEEVDVIIIGGGAAGCVVAGRLAKADPALEIAIIESGQDNVDMASSYQPAMYLSHLAPTSTTASFYASKESDALNGRGAIVPCGHVLGGGSSINFMMYTRGAASDYNDWKQPGWAFDDLLPLAQKMETCHLKGMDKSLHGYDGPLQVSYGGHRSNIGKEFVKAAQSSYDVSFTDDLQDFKTGHGLTNWAKWIDPKTGRRQDTATRYVRPVLETQKNLCVLTEQKTIRVIFDGDRATGVEYCQNPLARAAFNPEQPPTVGEVKTMKARKLVVISSGALGTPSVLERSGIGAKDVLEKAGVEVKIELPGVGAEYQDHQLALGTYTVDPEEDTLDDYLRGIPDVHAKVGPLWEKTGSGIVASNVIDAGMKCRPTEAEVNEMGPDFQKVWKEDLRDAKDKPVMFGGVVSTFLGDHSLLPPGRYMMMGAYLMYPYSKGHIHITSGDPFAPPDFDAGYLSHPADLEPQVWMYKRLREIARRMPTYRGEVAAIHPKFSAKSEARCRDIDLATVNKLKEPLSISAGVAPAGVAAAAADSAPNDTATGRHKLDGGKQDIEDLVYSEEDNEAVRDWVRSNTGTTWHSMATCPMKAKEAGGVVDARLNVYGTKGLKLADLSICPSNVGANTYHTALLVGERAAVIIGEDLGIKGV